MSDKALESDNLIYKIQNESLKNENELLIKEVNSLGDDVQDLQEQVREVRNSKIDFMVKTQKAMKDQIRTIRELREEIKSLEEHQEHLNTICIEKYCDNPIGDLEDGWLLCDEHLKEEALKTSKECITS